MNVDQLLAIVSDLSLFTTKEQLETKLSQCQTAYGEAAPEKARMLVAAIARIQNKIAAIEFSQRSEAQRAIKAAATIPRERFTARGAKSYP